MPDFHFVEDTMARVDSIVVTNISSTSQDIMIAISSVATQLLIIYMMFWGWSMMRGIIQEPVTDAVNRFIRLSIILGLATSLGLYQTYIVNFLWNTPDALASVITSNSAAANNGQFLDELFTQQYKFGSQFIEKARASESLIPDVAMIIAGWAVWVFSALIVGYAGFLMVLSKFGLAILIAVGPIFLLMLVFESTKRFFEQWLGQCITFILLVVLTAASIRMLFGIVRTYMIAIENINGSGSDTQYAQIFPLVFLCLVSVLVLLQLPSIASGLAGGVSISTMGFVNAAMNKTLGGLKSAKNLATGKSLSDYRAQRRHKINNARWAMNNPSKPTQLIIAAKKKFQRKSSSV